MSAKWPLKFKTSDKGPEVENQVAKTVNKRWSEKMDIGILKGKIEKYPVPVNCENLIPRVDMSTRSDTLFWFQANQSLFLPFNAVCLEKKQQIPIL